MTWIAVPLQELCRPRQWRALPAKNLLDAGYPVYGANGVIGYYDTFTHRYPVIAVGCRGTIGSVHITRSKSFVTSNSMALDELKDERVDLRFLARFLQFRGFKDVVSGSSQPQLTRQGISKVVVPLPPLDEQRRIAAILDQADAIRAKRRDVHERIGSLEDALLHERFDLLTLPRAAAAKIMPRMRNGVSPSAAGEVVAKSLTLTSITRGSFDSDKYKVASFDAEPANDKRVSEKDFLVCRGNGNQELVGVGTYSSVCRPDLVFPDTMIAGTVNDALVDMKFLEVCWRQPLVRQQILASARTTSGVYKVNQNSLGSVLIPLPPVEHQRAFAQDCARVSRAREVLTKALAADDALFASLQARAFKGEL